MARPLSLPWRIGVAVVPLAALLAFYPVRAPAPGAVADGFSIDRAWEHLRAITAGGAHPVESPVNDRVREYLLTEFGRLGLATSVQTASVFGREVKNVLARLPGSGMRGRVAVMLVAHYDSVRAGPGAGDDGAAVAALLETARCLAEGPRPRQDILFLISDGEEAGLLGARAFCGDENTAYKEDVRTRAALPQQGPPPHPALAEVALVLNFDARGSAGPSIMYETGPGNGRLIGHFARAAPYPVANSLSYDVYRMLRNDSDFTIFRRAGKQGLNFAFIGDYFNYHTPNDTPERLSGASMYHDGTYALALARHFANLDAAEVARINEPAQGNAVYFTLTSRWLVRYPGTLIWPLTAIQIAIGGWVISRAMRGGVVTRIGMLGGLARFVLALLLATGAVYGLGLMLRRPQSSAAFDWQVGAFVGVAGVITLAVALELRRRTSVADLGALGVIILSLISIPINVWVPGGSFLMVWPGLFLTGALAGAVYWPVGDWRRVVAGTVGSVPVVFVMVPLVLMLFVGLTLNMAVVLTPVVVLVVWLLVGVLGLVIGDGKVNRAGVVGGAHPT